MKHCRLTGFISLLLIATPLFAQPLTCTDASRDCLIQTATTYLDGVVSHNASQIPFATYVKRWDNGVNTGDNAVQLRHSIETDFGAQGIKGYRDLSWLVDGNDVLAFYLMDINFPNTAIYQGTTRIAEKFHIVNGLIEEIEVVFCNSPAKAPEESKMKEKKSFVCARSLI